MKRLKQQEGYLFDLDGTLLDSMGVWEQIDVDFLTRRNIPVPEDYAQAIAPMGFRRAAEYTIARFGFSQSPEEIMEEWHQMAVEQYAHHLSLKPGAKEYLEELKQQGKPLAVVTASYPELYQPALERGGVLDLFDTIVTVNQVPRGKGFPDIYLEAAKRIQVPPQQCAVFEDITQGIRGAKAADCLAVAVYDSANRGQWDQTKALADLSIRSFEELL